jgi:hypothetical protein
MSSTPVFSVVRVARSLVFCVMFCRSLFVLLLFFYWSLHCLSFFDLRLLVTPLVSCGHCIVCYSSNYGFWLPLWYLQTFDHYIVFPSSNYGFWLPLWYLVDIVLSVILRITASGYPFDILWTLYCLLLFELRFWLPLWYLVDNVLSVILRITASGYPFGILWTLYCLLFFELRFWLPLWYLVDIVLSVIFRITASGYPFGIFRLFLYGHTMSSLCALVCRTK